MVEYMLDCKKLLLVDCLLAPVSVLCFSLWKNRTANKSIRLKQSNHSEPCAEPVKHQYMSIIFHVAIQRVHG